MCNCIEDLNNKLKEEGQCLNTNILSSPLRPLISLIRTDKWIAENRRSKPKVIFCNYCPFCGQKYEIEKAEIAA